jgi:4-methoxybenzoate monooxygenase (O-demethylating)
LLDHTAPATEIDPYAPEFRDDPYEMYARLRELGPVVRLERYDAWVCTRYDVVQHVLSTSDTFRSGAGVGLAHLGREKHWRKPSILLENDPPHHTGVRAALMSVLTPKNIRRLRADLEPQAVAIVDRAIEQESFDAVAEIATPFPLRSFPNAVGLVADGREALIAYGRMVFDGMGPQNDIYDAVMADADDTVAWITAQCRREALEPGKLGDQVHAAADAGQLTHDEAALVVRSFLSAGIDTTIHALGSCLLALAQRPEQWRRIHEQPALVKRAFEETLRFDAPFQKFFRTTTEATRLADVDVAADVKVLLLVGSANRDPDKWESPDRFDLDRNPVGQLGFGAGIHGCVGQMIARLEADVLLGELARRVESMELTGEPEWQPSNSLRGLGSLPLRITPAAGVAGGT